MMIFVTERGAHLAAEWSPSVSEGGCSEAQRNGAKPRGRGFGQRNITSPTPSDLTYTTRPEIPSIPFC